MFVPFWTNPWGDGVDVPFDCAADSANAFVYRLKKVDLPCSVETVVLIVVDNFSI